MHRYHIRLPYGNTTKSITVVDLRGLHDFSTRLKILLSEKKTSVFLLDETSMEQQPQTPRLVNISTADEILISEVSHDSKTTN